MRTAFCLLGLMWIGACQGSAPSSVSGLEVRDSRGCVRLATEEQADGSFALVLFGADAKRQIVLRSGGGDSPLVEICDNRGVGAVTIGPADGSNWGLRINSGASDVRLQAAAGGAGLRLECATDDSGHSADLSVSEHYGPKLVMRDQAGDRVIIGKRGEGDWLALVDGGGSTSAGLVSGFDASTIAIGGLSRQKYAWMSSIVGGPGAAIGVSQDGQEGSGAMLLSSPKFAGMTVRSNGSVPVGLGVDGAASSFWMGSSQVAPDAALPGMYASWSPDRGAAFSLRHSQVSPCVLLQDIADRGSGVSIGSKAGEHLKVGIRADGTSIVDVVNKDGSKRFELPKQGK